MKKDERQAPGALVPKVLGSSGPEALRRLSWRWLGRMSCVLLCSILWLPDRSWSQSSTDDGTAELGLESFIKLVLERNESIQARMLELEANQRKLRAEKGIFEPELSGSASRESNKRQNTAMEQRSELGAPFFSERNNIYQTGLEGLVPTGARIRLGYTLRDLRNNLQEPVLGTLFTNHFGREYQSFAGVSVTQPLLKNAWFPATLAGIRLAALSSDIAFQDYRRQMMLILSTAEATYWNLYLAQEQVRFFNQSVATAEKILEDTRARQQAGKSAELDVLQAEAGLALRRSKLSEAEEKLHEAANKLMAFYSDRSVGADRLIRATDRPQPTPEAPSLLEAWQIAFAANPDYLMQRQKLKQEEVRVRYARNQRLPEFNLKGSYGLNGLGDSPGASLDQLDNAGFPSWSIGVELKVPLAGGIKSANELAAAKLRRKEAELNLSDTETQVINGLDTALHKLRNARESAQNYQKVVDFNQKLLDSAIERMEVGKLENQKVLEIEADLFEARNSQVESLVNWQRALLELEFIEGSVLRRRQIEMTQEELQNRTSALIHRRKLDGPEYQQFIREMQTAYENKRLAPLPRETPELKKAREAPFRQWLEWNNTNFPSVRTNSATGGAPSQGSRKNLEELK